MHPLLSLRLPDTDLPVGGRLQAFSAQWSLISEDPWVLSTVRDGYRLELTRIPFLSAVPWAFPVPNDPDLARLVKAEVDQMLDKGAIEVVEDGSPGFYSPIFLVPKKTGGWRPVLNLRRLNKFMEVRHFRMESTRALAQVIRDQDWAISVDLKDAYFQVLVHPESRPFLRFFFRNRVYQFRALPFGLATSPRVFSRLVACVAATCHRFDLHFHFYLDDWLLRNPSREQLLDQSRLLLQLTNNLGFLVNWEKSQLVPSQRFRYLGVEFESTSGLMFPPSDRVERIISLTTTLSRASKVRARFILQWLGLVNSAADQVDLGRLHMRPVQIWLLAVWRPSSGQLDASLSLPGPLLQIVWEFWSDRNRLLRGVPLRPHQVSDYLVTDASQLGWGAHLGGLQISGGWSLEESSLHINVLELLAVQKALSHFRRSLSGPLVLVRCDNFTVVQYLNREGGTRSPTMCRYVWDLLKWCEAQGLRLRAQHVPGQDNILADALSRGKKLASSDWTLDQSIVDAICELWDDPMVDLFALRRNARRPIFVSPFPEQGALTVDALAMDWNGLSAYAFPPVPLLPLVLGKLEEASACHLILIAPFWPSQVWFPRLLEALIDLPRHLPARQDLVRLGATRVGRFHRNPESLNLHAWRVSSDHSRREDFRQRLRTELPPRKGSRRSESTTLNGTSSLVGVLNGTPIHAIRLFSV